MPGVLAGLGLARVINAAGTLTRLGGAPMAEEVIAAMAEAARASLDMAALQERASAEIAAATGAEAGLVTTGAAAGLTLAAAAALAGLDPARMAALPRIEEGRSEILVHRTHRSSYTRALAVAGARLIDFGHNDRGTDAGIRGIETWEIEAAITPRTAAVFFAATPLSASDLPLFAHAAHAHGLPVIVDAAAQLPPAANLRRFIADGADLVVFSGGKAIGGPQSSGILAGRRTLIASAFMQMLDMDVPVATWHAPFGVQISGVPHHGLGRGFKAGKEEIVGLLVALRRFLARDEAAEQAAQEARLRAIAAALPIRTTLLDAATTGRVPILALHVDDASGLAARLRAGDPPVHLGERRASEGVLLIDPQALRPEDDAALIAAIRQSLTPDFAAYPGST
jgi:L-seryl-tRNA(Ser) seleniumtransferase